LERYVFTCGHHIRTVDDQIARLDHISLHDYDDKRFIFLVLTLVHVSDQKDPGLGLHMVAYDMDKPMIISIDQVRPEKLYIIPVNENLTVLVDWQVEWL
jgi:hypothetical protein